MTVAVLYTKVRKDSSKDDLDTLMQVKAVTESLEELNHKVDKVACTNDISSIATSLKKRNPGIVFNLVEPLQGEGQFIYIAPTVFDYLKLPYTGCSSESIYITSNKVLAKKLMRMAGIPTPEWSVDGNIMFSKSDSPFRQRRFIIKSIWEHASAGIDEKSVVLIKKPNDLSEVLECRNLSSRGLYFAEEYIEGREFNLSLLAKGMGVEVLPPAEMKFIHFPEKNPKVLGYRAKWDEGSTEYANTQRSFDFSSEEQPLLEILKALSLRCWDTFGLNGYARVDFRIDGENNPYVLEINANPCISPSSGFVAAACRAHLSYGEMIKRILNSPIISHKLRSRSFR